MKLIKAHLESAYEEIARFIRRYESSKGPEKVFFWIPQNLDKFLTFCPASDKVKISFPLIWKIEGDRTQYRICNQFYLLLNKQGELVLPISDRVDRGSQSASIIETLLTNTKDWVRDLVRETIGLAPTYEKSFKEEDGTFQYFRGFEDFQQWVKQIDPAVTIQKKSKFQYLIDDGITLLKLTFDLLETPREIFLIEYQKLIKNRTRTKPFKEPSTRIIISKDLARATASTWHWTTYAIYPSSYNFGAFQINNDCNSLYKEPAVKKKIYDQISEMLDLNEEVREKLKEAQPYYLKYFDAEIRISLPDFKLGNNSFILRGKLNEQPIFMTEKLTEKQLDQVLRLIASYTNISTRWNTAIQKTEIARFYNDIQRIF